MFTKSEILLLKKLVQVELNIAQTSNINVNGKKKYGLKSLVTIYSTDAKLKELKPCIEA